METKNENCIIRKELINSALALAKMVAKEKPPYLNSMLGLKLKSAIDQMNDQEIDEFLVILKKTILCPKTLEQFQVYFTE